MPLYDPRFAIGETVRVIGIAQLAAFLASWKFHNPLRPEQMAVAGRVAVVRAIGIYHGGDPLYELSDVPGVWHEQCLERS